MGEFSVSGDSRYLLVPQSSYLSNKTGLLRVDFDRCISLDQWHGQERAAHDHFGFDKLTDFGNQGTLRSDFNTFHDRPVEGNGLQPPRNPARLQWKDGPHESHNNPSSMAKNSRDKIPYVNNQVPRAQTDNTHANQMQSHVVDTHDRSSSAAHSTNTEDQDFMEFILNQDFDQWLKDPHLDVSNEQSGIKSFTPYGNSNFHLGQSSRASQQQIDFTGQQQEGGQKAISSDTSNREKIRLMHEYPNPTESRLKSWGQSSDTAHHSEGSNIFTGDLRPRPVMLENLQEDSMNPRGTILHSYSSSKSPILPSSFDISAMNRPNNPSDSQSFKHDSAHESGTTSVENRPVSGSGVPPRAYYPNVKDIEKILTGLTGPTLARKKTSNIANAESESINGKIARVESQNNNKPVESNRPMAIINDSPQIESRGSSEPGKLPSYEV